MSFADKTFYEIILYFCCNIACVDCFGKSTVYGHDVNNVILLEHAKTHKMLQKQKLHLIMPLLNQLKTNSGTKRLLAVKKRNKRNL